MPAEVRPLAGPRRHSLGILAGSGPLPLEVAAAARGAGRPVYVVAIKGFASNAIASYPHTWVNIGQVGTMIRGFRQTGCTEIVIVGGMRRPNLWKVKVDFGFFRAIGTVLKMTRGGDDSILRRIVRFFELEGFRVCGVQEVAPHLLAPVGVLGHIQPSEAQRAAIKRGAALIGALGDFDVGQAAVVTASEVLAIEGVRGTDAMLEQVRLQAGNCTGETGGAGVLVKLPKPGQEMRIDLPVIGPETIERTLRAGLGGVAVRGGQSLVVKKEEVVRRADAGGVFVVGLAGNDGDGEFSRDQATADATPLQILGRRAPTPADRSDIALGRRLMQVLAVHDAGDAAVIVGEHVLAINTGTPVAAMLTDGIRSGSHWGRRAFRKRLGVLVVRSPDVIVDDSQIPGEDVIRLSWVAEAGLAGIVCASGAFPEGLEQPAIEQANQAGLFLMAPARAA